MFGWAVIRCLITLSKKIRMSIAVVLTCVIISIIINVAAVILAYKCALDVSPPRKHILIFVTPLVSPVLKCSSIACVY